jgi:AraC-like DNA-binding protein
MLQSILGLDAALEAIKLRATGIITNHRLCDKEPEKAALGRPRKYTYEAKEINGLYENGSDLHSMELSLGMPQAYIGTIIDRYRLRHNLPAREGFEKIVLSDKLFYLLPKIELLSESMSILGISRELGLGRRSVERSLKYINGGAVKRNKFTIVAGYRPSTGEMVVRLHSVQGIADAGYDPDHITKCLRGKQKLHKRLIWRRINDLTPFKITKPNGVVEEICRDTLLLVNDVMKLNAQGLSRIQICTELGMHRDTLSKIIGKPTGEHNVIIK